MKMEQKIAQKLQDTLQPDVLRVTNESHLHIGHAGNDGSGESHFRIEISSPRFKSVNRVERERMIYKALDNEMALIHALSIKIL